MASLAFDVHPDFESIPTARVYRASLMDAETCGDIIRLANAIGATQARQSADPGLNRVLRVPVNGTGADAVEARLALLQYAFDIHARATASPKRRTASPSHRRPYGRRCRAPRRATDSWPT